jgi:hypothetical protein
LGKDQEQSQEPVNADVTSLSGANWKELCDKAQIIRSGPPTIEASRRVVVALKASEQSATKLGTRIWWLNLGLLIFTIAICALTVVLVLVELGVMKRPHEQGTGSAWVLWSRPYDPTPSTWVLQTAYPTIAACTQDLDQREKNVREAKWSADRRAATDLFILYTRDGTKLDIRDRPKGGTTWQCFPDTVDPRGPKGK